MADTVTLQQVEELAANLPPGDQLRLVARVTERLTDSVALPGTPSKKEVERLRKERAREAAAILRECDRAATAFTRETDCVETIRRLREERLRSICRSG